AAVGSATSAPAATPNSVETTTAPATVVPTPRAELSTPGPTVSGPLALASSAFEDGGAIPSRFTCDGRDISPPLAWTNVPDGTVSFLLTMRDLDADGFLHWIAWNIPATTRSLDPGASGDMPGDAGEGKSDFAGARRGYRGPCPPSGTHHYVLTLYALPLLLADAATTPPARLEGAAGEIALGLATLRGAYRRH
ncbi:MAG TPA: YbhB/YbcL family Raf kinase inhibitor-like protein, partial [Candidatus Saccharimonadia bacterium]|nr:YbhB/YbcL family Raf kinase inhibitor-like protein [Candidatus Saccharimonadia bacterium]